MKELDIVIGGWASKNIFSLNKEECHKYYEEVLQIETPDILRLLTIRNLTTEETDFLNQTRFLKSIKENLFN